MASYNYRSVYVVLAEADPDISGVISSALFPRGLRDITICRDRDSLREAMNLKPVDVLMCDAQLAGLDFVGTIQNIRQNRLGTNPFVHIIATMNVSAHEQIQRVIGSGVDDLIRKPMPAVRVLNRFDSLTKARKPFVIAETYFGPNRRKAPRPGDEEGMIDVPNTLRAKVVDNTHRNDVAKSVREAWADVLRRKQVRRPRALTVLTDRIMAFYDGRGTEEELRRDLGYLVAKSDELITMYKDSDAPHIAEIAFSMGGIVRRIMTSPMRPKKTDMRLMPHVTEATRLSTQSPQESADTVREVAEMIRSYLKMPKLSAVA